MAKKTEKLDYSALRRQLKAEGPGPLYMLWGPEDYLISDLVGRLRNSCLAEGMKGWMQPLSPTHIPIISTAWAGF